MQFTYIRLFYKYATDTLIQDLPNLTLKYLFKVISHIMEAATNEFSSVCGRSVDLK